MKKQVLHDKQPDGIRRKFLQAGAVSVAAVASLISGGDKATAKSADEGAFSDQLRELQAREEIKELRAKYCWYATRSDAESYRTLFTEDCRFEYKVDGERRWFEGPDAISAIVAAISPGTVTPIIGNHTIVIDGDEAAGTCAARNTIRGPDGTSVTVSGFYSDRFRFEEGRWKFLERRWFTYSPEYEENDQPLI